MITIIVDTLTVFYYENMVGYAPSSFADLVFAGKRIEAGLKRGKFDHPALMNEKTGANEEDENEEGTHVVAAIPTWPNFPPAQQCHRSANIGPSHYPSPNHPQKSSPNQPQGMPAYHTPNAQTPPIAQTKKEFCSKKPIGFTPNSGAIC